MNVYDFDKTIYDGDSTADFYLFCLGRHKKILLTVPSLFAAFIKFYVFRRGSKTEFKQVMYRFLTCCEPERDLKDFWDKNIGKIKTFYLKQQKESDVIISASPLFLLTPACERLGIKHLMASNVDVRTGIYSGVNCHGEEKVRRYREKFGNEKIDEFYSDSYSDAPLAEIAGRAYLVKKNEILNWDKSRCL